MAQLMITRFLLMWVFSGADRPDSFSFKVGGLRVKKIISRDSVGNTVTRSFRYKLEDSEESSGIIDGCPTYKVHEIDDSYSAVRQYYGSNSVFPLTSDGKTVHYKSVSEYYDSVWSSFRTDYTFVSAITDPYLFAAPKTGAPLVSWSWQHSLLQRKQDYEKTSTGAYRILADEEHSYSVHEPLMHLYGLYGDQIIRYSIATEWYLPEYVTTTAYSYAGAVQTSSQTIINTTYNNRHLPAVVSTVNSKGNAIQSKTWYPSDYNDVSGYNIGTLLSKHILAVPVKQESSVSGKIKAGSIIRYNAYGQPTDGYSYESAALSDTVTHSRGTVLESNYILKTSLGYDMNGSIKQLTHFKAGPSAYIWGE
ncbi:MAG: hypothetical protein WDO16_02215 [Bacteroidota bacterium]